MIGGLRVRLGSRNSINGFREGAGEFETGGRRPDERMTRAFWLTRVSIVRQGVLSG